MLSHKHSVPRMAVALTVLALGYPASAWSAAQAGGEKQQKIELAEGKYTLTAPNDWKRVRPRIRLIEHEFVVPPAEQEKGAQAKEPAPEEAARLTVMSAGGSIEDNIKRWYGQFEQADQKGDEEQKAEELEIAGRKVHVVRAAGTFRDQRGPFAPAVERENYRLLGAIIETPDAGNYFLKMTGPEEVVEANEKEFLEMLRSLKARSNER